MSMLTASTSLSERLNRKCFCITLDWTELCAALDYETGDPGFCKTFMTSPPHLFSNVPVFLAASALDEMQRIVVAIEATAKLPAYRAAVLSWAPEIAQRDFGPVGALMGYDFHIDVDGPKLIEVNTNAGGAFLNALQARAQRACCSDVDRALIGARDDRFETSVIAMFTAEWRRQRGAGSPRRIAIVDDRAEEQYLYPEFVLARQLLLKHGVEAVIGDASELKYDGDRLRLDGDEIDLVYNRLVDFALDEPEHAALRAAYQDGAVVLTPQSAQPRALCKQAQSDIAVRPGGAGSIRPSPGDALAARRHWPSGKCRRP